MEECGDTWGHVFIGDTWGHVFISFTARFLLLAFFGLGGILVG